MPSAANRPMVDAVHGVPPVGNNAEKHTVPPNATSPATSVPEGLGDTNQPSSGNTAAVGIVGGPQDVDGSEDPKIQKCGNELRRVARKGPGKNSPAVRASAHRASLIRAASIPRRVPEHVEGDTWRLPMPDGRHVLISACDVERVAPLRWCITVNGRKVPYAGTNLPDGKFERLHRFIVGAVKGDHVDHINGDTLDNRRENLRICTQRQNNQNRNPFEGDRVVGVRRLGTGRYAVNVNSRNRGVFPTEAEAVLTRDVVVLAERGEFAKLALPRDLVDRFAAAGRGTSAYGSAVRDAVKALAAIRGKREAA